MAERLRPTFEVHEEIAQARTPPGWLYTDPAVFDTQREAVFARSWQWVGDVDMARIPGQVTPFTLLDGYLDEPLLLTRDMDDQVRAISNVCTHRGMLVCESGGNERFLRCRYHGRRFGLDGKFQHMPEFEGVQDFPSAQDDLRAVGLQAWGPFFFVSLAPQTSLATLIAPMAERLAWMPLHEFRHDPEASRDYVVKANWALYCDNYLEGFHIPFIHAGLNEVIDYGSYDTICHDWMSLQLAVSKGGDDVFDLPASSPDHGQAISAYYYWLFPNMMFNFYPWGLSINVVRPLAVDLTRVSFIRYVWDESRLGRGAGAALDRVEREDEVVVEGAHVGLRSRFYAHGRYAPAREVGTHHFHRLLARAMGVGERK